MQRLLPVLLMSLVWPSAGCGTADLVLRNGKIVTLEQRKGIVQALAVRGDRILAVGDDAGIARYIGPQTRVIDLQGRLAVPGFIEGHGHLTGIGEARLTLDLSDAANWHEVIAVVQEAAAQAEPGDWIVGRGWHQDKWDRIPERSVEGFPSHHALSAVTPHNPVCLRHASGHACFFNAAAMELARIDARSPDPPGGEIIRDSGGEPCGVFRENAQNLVARVYRASLAQDPARSQARLRRAIRIADRECLQKGVTSFQDAGSSFETIDTFADMVSRGQIGTRLWVMVSAANSELARRLPEVRRVGRGGNKLTVRAVKRLLDGALGSRGAWLLTPYADLPGSSGMSIAGVEDVAETARLAREHDFQLCVHAIGDRANREVLDIFERTFGDPRVLRERRWRVEHAQHLHPADIPRFAHLGVIASMQGSHCTSDAPFVVDRLGFERARTGAYVWRALWDSGAVVSNGTDAPVEDVSPIRSFHALVSRRSGDGPRFFPEQRLERMEALKCCTLNGAYAAFEEHLKGSLAPGKLADIVVLSQDILTCPEPDILDTQVLYTIVGGEVLYERETPGVRAPPVAGAKVCK